jgi:hypothetical protein
MTTRRRSDRRPRRPHRPTPTDRLERISPAVQPRDHVDLEVEVFNQRRIAGIGLHPRLAKALLDGADAVGATAAAEVVALLDDDALATGTDVEVALRRLRADEHSDGARQWRREVRRLSRLVADPSAAGKPDPAFIAALAHPERLARRARGCT